MFAAIWQQNQNNNENIQNISNCKRMSNYISVYIKMNNLGLYNISVKSVYSNFKYNWTSNFA